MNYNDLVVGFFIGALAATIIMASMVKNAMLDADMVISGNNFRKDNSVYKCTMVKTLDDVIEID